MALDKATREEIRDIVNEALTDFFEVNGYVSKSEAARILGKTLPTVYSYLKKGILIEKNGKIQRKSILNINTQTL